MATPPRHPVASRAFGTLMDAFWLLVLSVIVLFVFFLALGSFSISEVGWVAIAVGALVVLWIVHALLQRRHRPDTRDPRLVHARERRGF